MRLRRPPEGRNSADFDGRHEKPRRCADDKPGEAERPAEANDIGEDHQTGTAQAVAHHAREQPADQCRQAQNAEHQAEMHGRGAAVQHQRHQGDRHHPIADVAERLPDPQEPEVTARQYLPVSIVTVLPVQLRTLHVAYRTSR